MSSSTPAAAPARPQFFARTGLLMLVMVLSAFPVSYFAPAVTGSRPFQLTHHIHGLIYFAWIGLYAWQCHLVAMGRTARHRELGLAGIAISALMVPLGIDAMRLGIERRVLAGSAHPYDTTLFNVCDLTAFTVLMIASIATVTRSLPWHRRWTYGAAVCLVGPAISRWFFGPWFVRLPELPPFTDMAPNLVADLFLLALARFDRRTLGQIHPATWWLIGTLIPLTVLTPFFASSDGWRALAPILFPLK